MSYLIIKYSIPLAEFQVCSNFYAVLFNFRCVAFLFYQTHAKSKSQRDKQKQSLPAHANVFTFCKVTFFNTGCWTILNSPSYTIYKSMTAFHFPLRFLKILRSQVWRRHFLDNRGCASILGKTSLPVIFVFPILCIFCFILFPGNKEIFFLIALDSW